eukprot:scaffold3110_cov341-Prasinococcus_capsulatus_cf.AAC.3
MASPTVSVSPGTAWHSRVGGYAGVLSGQEGCLDRGKDSPCMGTSVTKVRNVLATHGGEKRISDSRRGRSMARIRLVDCSRFNAYLGRAPSVGVELQWSSKLVSSILRRLAPQEGVH